MELLKICRYLATENGKEVEITTNESFWKFGVWCKESRYGERHIENTKF